jgi:glucose-1-phosphate thymidylyltransferase
MKNIVIAAGYATRLYPLTEHFPKPLLKIGSHSILDRLLDDIDTIDEVDEHIIITNHKFANQFKEWMEERKSENSSSKPIRIIDDGTETNETRLGAVRDFLLAIKDPGLIAEKSSLNREETGGSFLVTAADNLLDFSFQGFVDFAKEKGTSCIMCHHQPSIEKLQRTGVIEKDANGKVLSMEEKPEHPKSHWAVPPFYIYMKQDLPLILDCLNHGCGSDAPGNLAHYLAGVTTLHAYEMPGTRFDIGSLDTYEEAKRLFGNPPLP